MAYTKTQWVNDSEPPISAENLNKMEQGIFDAQPQEPMDYSDYQALTPAEKNDGKMRLVKDYPGGTINASNVGFDNTGTQLSNNVQGAINDLNVNLTQLFTLGTDNGWNYRKWSNGYFEAWKKDIRNATGQSKTVMGLTGSAFTKAVPYPSFITNLQQIISAVSNVKVGNGYSVQVYQNITGSGISIEAMSNTTGEQSFETTHYIYGRLSTTLSAPPTEE